MEVTTVAIRSVCQTTLILSAVISVLRFHQFDGNDLPVVGLGIARLGLLHLLHLFTTSIEATEANASVIFRSSCFGTLTTIYSEKF